jgi:peptidoglycan/LPS O-acetylase OafA/YrhL
MMTQARFPTLDLLRGIAAIVVVLGHGTAIFNTPVSSVLCVDLFFVLSGFVLGYAYDHRLQDGMSGTVFLRARLIRLYPLYLVGTMLGLLAFRDTMQGVPELLTLAFTLVFLPTPFTPVMFPLNPPAWSLFFELFINIVYGFARPARLGAIVCVMAVALVVTTLAYGTLDSGIMWGGFARVGFSFFAGLLAWRFFARRERRPLPSWMALVLTAAFCAIVGLKPAPQWQLAFELSAVLVGFPAIIYLAARTPLSGAMQTVATQAGLASYALYVIHWPLLRLLEPFHTTGSLLCWGVLPAMIAISIVLERTVHEPIKSWLLGGRPLRNQAERPLPVRSARASRWRPD